MIVFKDQDVPAPRKSKNLEELDLPWDSMVSAGWLRTRVLLKLQSLISANNHPNVLVTIINHVLKNTNNVQEMPVLSTSTDFLQLLHQVRVYIQFLYYRSLQLVKVYYMTKFISFDVRIKWVRKKNWTWMIRLTCRFSTINVSISVFQSIII